MAFTPTPTPPNSGDPGPFNARMDAMLAWFPGFVAELTAQGYPDLPALLPNGSALLPAMAFASDADTGLYRIGPNILGIATGGAERVRVTNAGMDVTGRLGGSAVTQSRYDTTAGLIPVAGWMGLGALLRSPGTDEADLNLLERTGFYSFGSDTPNGPGGFGIVIQLARFTTSEQVQIAFRADSQRISSRRRGAGGGATWTEWREVYHQGAILGTASQSGGVPTGALIERGSNANGSYVRLSDGTQICWQRITANTHDWAQTSGAMFRDAVDQTWTFPAAFSAAPSPSDGIETGTMDPGGAAFRNVSGTSLLYRGWSALSRAAGTTKVIHLTATGRWF